MGEFTDAAGAHGDVLECSPATGEQGEAAFTAAAGRAQQGVVGLVVRREDLPALADGGYEGAGQGVHLPFKRPGDGNVLAIDHLAYNALQRGLRALGERGFALLTGRWRALQRITASPSRIGDITAAARMLTEYEQRDLRRSC